MAIQLYREGDTHEIKGIKCELSNFPIHQLDARLKEGWVKSPEDISNGKNDNEKDSEEKESEKIRTSEKGAPDIRALAKEAGIEGWDTKRIKTLEAALNDNKD